MSESKTKMFRSGNPLFQSGMHLSYRMTMGADHTAAGDTGSRARTRRAILDAAITVLAKEPGASLGEIAVAAGVGRTTVHRYFPERSDLLAAIANDMLEKVEAATARARLDEGPALEALDRLCQEYFDLGDGLTLLFNDPQLMNLEEWGEESESDRALLALVERGRAEGTIDPELDPHWVVQVLWCLLYGAWEMPRWYGTPKHASVALCLRTLRKAVGAS
jgi:AcrR family transcriptional regulator